MSHFYKKVAFWLVFVVALVGAFKFGEPEAHDNKRRGANAKAMLSRLYDAAKERADRIRAADGTTTAPMRGEDMLSSLFDYARDKIKKPPLRSVERNFIKIKQDIQLIVEELHKQRELLSSLASADPHRGDYTNRQKEHCTPVARTSSEAAHRQHDACVCRDASTELLACLSARQVGRHLSKDPTGLMWAARLQRNKLEPVQGSKYTEL